MWRSSTSTETSPQFVRGKIVTLPRYVTDYRQNWTAPTLTAMSSHEKRWAYDWTCELLASTTIDTEIFTREDLTMLARILGMALAFRKPKHPLSFKHDLTLSMATATVFGRSGPLDDWSDERKAHQIHSKQHSVARPLRGYYETSCGSWRSTTTL